jgi:3-dehydroquinate dehydratase-1
VGRTHAAVLAELADILPKKPDLIEWRVDFFENIGDTAIVINVASRIREAAGGIPIIFTCRLVSEGGERIPLTDDDTLKLYVAACASGCVDLIDYEMSNPAENLVRLRYASRDNDVAMILTYHNYQHTPKAADLYAQFMNAERHGADIAKVAVMPKGPEDVLTLLGATWRASEASQIPVVGLSMDGSGALSRLFGWVYGSAMTYAVGKNRSAPGQVPIEELHSVLNTVDHALEG